MAASNDAVVHAKEVDAACATIGFDEGYVPRLKGLLDECDASDLTTPRAG